MSVPFTTQEFVRESASRITGGLVPERADLARLRIEVFVAAAHDPVIGAALGKVLRSHDVAHAKVIKANDKKSKDRTRDVAHLLRAIPLGLQLTSNLVEGLERVDWRPFMEPLAPHLAPKAWNFPRTQ